MDSLELVQMVSVHNSHGQFLLFKETGQGNRVQMPDPGIGEDRVGRTRLLVAFRQPAAIEAGIFQLIGGERVFPTLGSNPHHQGQQQCPHAKPRSHGRDFLLAPFRPPGFNAGMTFHIEVPTRYEELESLQRRAWGCLDLEVVPAHTLQALAHHGGCLLALREDGPVLGFVLGFVAGDYLYSHLAAVLPEHQGRGLATRLKLAQKDWARERGLKRVVWTFDPLQVANARLNIAKLGARAHRYKVNLYGELHDDLNRGLETDRLEVDWWITPPPLESVADRVEFPWPLETLEQRQLWRQRTRSQFQQAFQKRLVVTGFALEAGRAHYTFGKEASRED